jgi:uncharacterized NAD(P)/FAD-binding protein YdhS
MHAHRTLAIVGGGSVATSVLCQLAARTKERGPGSLRKILLFEPNPQPGAGAAYQRDVASNLLNTRVGSMSPLALQPEHFQRWLEANRSAWRADFPGLVPTPDSFVPRALFGMYLDEVYATAAASLGEQGVPVVHVRQTVSDIRRIRGQFVLRAGREPEAIASEVVLAIGNLETAQWAHLHDSPGYFRTPYPCRSLVEQIDRRASVCILGSSLSAIDAAVCLGDAGHTGKIVMVSRNGRLPSVRGEHNQPRKPVLLSRERVRALAESLADRLSLEELARLLLRELELWDGQSADLETILRAGDGPQRYIDSEIEDASLCDRTWQAVVYGLNDSIDTIWHALPAAQKRLFQARFKSLWHSYRVSFPIANARKLQQLLHRDQLTVYSGYKDAFFDEAAARFGVSVADSSRGFEATLYADRMVNATGYTTDVAASRSSLIRSMLASGLVQADEFGGIELDFDTGQALGASGRVVEGLYALGSLACGTYFWTNAMSVNARLAAGVADRLWAPRAQPSAPVGWDSGEEPPERVRA